MATHQADIMGLIRDILLQQANDPRRAAARPAALLAQLHCPDGSGSVSEVLADKVTRGAVSVAYSL